MLEHERWLKIAKEDLMIVKISLHQKLLSIVTDYCHQSAEKSLKGYLVFKKNKIVKTLDLIKLVELCKKFDTDFEKLYGSAKYLNPFATRFRYHTELDSTTFAEADISAKHAENILKFVIKKISEPETGQSDIFEIE